MLKGLARGVRSAIRRLGFDIVRYVPPLPNGPPRAPDSWNQLERLASINTLIDIGVHQGTPDLYRRFPGATLVLVDPLVESKSFVEQHPELSGVAGRSWRFVNRAVGEREGSVELSVESHDFGKSSLLGRTELTRTHRPVEKRSVEMTTLDRLARELQLELDGTVGLKIDTEGYELAVLNGGREMIPRCEFVITELSIAKRFEASYQAQEVIRALDDLGFSIAAILDINRDRDGVVRHLDVAFERRK